MVYYSILDRSFGKHGKKKMAYGAILGSFVMSLTIYTMFKPGLNPIQALNLKVSNGIGLTKMVMTKETTKIYQDDFQTEQTTIGNITGETSSLDLEDKNLKVIPNNSEQKPSDIQTKGATQIHNISRPEYALIQADQTETNSKILAPKPINIEKENIEPIHTISRTNSTAIQSEKASKKTNILEPICNTLQPKTDVCEMSGDIRIDSKSSTVILSLPKTTLLPENSSWNIKPYARKEDKRAMGLVREFQVKMVNSQYEEVPRCTQKHKIVGILFSSSGYSGNHFHTFTDILIPLYLTSREFDGEVKFLVTNYIPQWINKFIAIIQKLSKYEVIDIDKENEVHCFPKMIVGLKRHKEFNIDPSRSQQSMTDFRNLLREAYSLKTQRAIALNNQTPDKKVPRLLIISRRRTRSFLNEDEIINMGKNLGFEVIKAEADQNEGRFAKIVNSCDVMMGVHGAGLTNIIFLPEKAVFIQILPLGDMDWMAKTDFGEPAKGMNLRYLEYKINENESSLIEEYPPNHSVLRDPNSISRKGWLAFKEVYLDKQNVKLDVGRFRKTLMEALKLLHD